MIGTKLSGAATRRALAGAVSGVLAAAAALGVAQLVAGVTGPLGSPVVAVGEVAINLTPVPVKDFVIAHVGSHDKQVLVAGILVVLAAFAAAVGMAALRRIGYGLAGLVMALFGLMIVLTSPVRARMIDRYGPRRALPPMAGAFGAVLVAIAVIPVRSGFNDAAIAVLAAAAGTCAPPLGVVMRRLWSALIEDRGVLREHQKVLVGVLGSGEISANSCRKKDATSTSPS